MDKVYDIAILGGGPGGYAAAIRASQLGASVVLIEKERLGGTCLTRGCIPTKALLACTSFFEKIKKSESFGIKTENTSIDLKKVVERKNTLVDKLVKGIEFLIDKNKIDLIYAEGKIISETKIEAVKKDGTKEDISFKKLIIATGSLPFQLPSIDFDGINFLSSDDILNNFEIPEKLDVVGGGVIGLHFAFMYSSLGTEVSIYEALPDILFGIDEEVVALAKRILSRRKIKIITNTKFTKEDSCGKTLISVGRVPNTEGLSALPFKFDKKSLWTNEKMETSIKGIYAIGDVTSKKMFAHVATEQGIIAVENALGSNKTFDYSCIPYTIYTNPEIASVGLTEKQAKEMGIIIKIGKFPFSALGISYAMGEIEGFIKIVADENNKILGVHIIGPEANTIIGSATIAVKNGLTTEKLGETIQSHPSFPEGLQESALSALKRSIHALN